LFGASFRTSILLVNDSAQAHGYDVALISGTTRQLRLYRHMGFVPFGPLVVGPGAQFQPMMLTLERFAPRAPKLFRGAWHASRTSVANFLPGPVAVRQDVRDALDRPVESHRSAAFAAELLSTRTCLCELVGARRAEILLGSGTAANDAVAGQLSLERGPGLVLSNGEFGERLVDHARRFRLRFDVVTAPWGHVFDLDDIGRRLAGPSAPAWLWFVHCETSTGALNDLEGLLTLCSAAGVKLCVDAISSLGSVPLDLADVHLASGVSGKGLGAFPGLAIVFYNHHIAPAPDALPRYLDLGLYAHNEGVPFTHSSNLVRALLAAIEGRQWNTRFSTVAETSACLRRRLGTMGFDLVVPDDRAAPGVVTVALPGGTSSMAIGLQLEQQGYLVSIHSRYLLERNWIQICLMGDSTRAQLTAVSDALVALCGDHSCTAATPRC
jgi:aspartate aminotransferase-like enzyme